MRALLFQASIVSFPGILILHSSCTARECLLSTPSADIDECASSAYCPDNATCANQPGSFECFCDGGYIMQNGLCVGEVDTHLTCPLYRLSSLSISPWFSDVDECVENRSLCGDLRCVNTDGGYRCDCYPGYMKDDTGLCRGEAHPRHLSMNRFCLPNGTWILCETFD